MMQYMTLTDMTRSLRAGAISPTQVATATLDLIERFDPVLNCFAHFDPEDVLRQAADVEARMAAGEDVGPLAGAPVPIKDLIAVKGMPLRFGSKVTSPEPVGGDAPSVARIRAAGGVILGKSTTSEFGCKAVGDSPLTGITRNPWDLESTPGGSSAGAAALVASGISPVSIGTDGGGSIRIPAALSGLYGIKAQFGRVPVYPTSATPTLAHVGPLARTVEDAAFMLSIIAGEFTRDPSSMLGPTPDFLGEMNKAPAPLRIAWAPTLGYAEPLPEVIAACSEAVETLSALGHHVTQVDELFGGDPAALWMAEFYAGVGTKLIDPLTNRRAELDEWVADILDEAVGQQMRDYYSKVFDRYAFREQVESVFDQYDVILTPTVPTPSFPVGLPTPPTHTHRNIVSWVYYTYPFNLTGHPASSVPVGFSTDGLPIGLQAVTGIKQETRLLQLSRQLEQAKPWGGNRPKLPS